MPYGSLPLSTFFVESVCILFVIGYWKEILFYGWVRLGVAIKATEAGEAYGKRYEFVIVVFDAVRIGKLDSIDTDALGR